MRPALPPLGLEPLTWTVTAPAVLWLHDAAAMLMNPELRS
jgi:hypothetical protein